MTTEQEKISYYFEQFWAFHNPAMLRMGDLTDEMERIYGEEWKKISGGVENKTMMVGDNFKARILGKPPKRKTKRPPKSRTP